MEKQFYLKNETLHVNYRLTIPKEVSKVWQYLTETTKIQEWFKEIEVGSLQTEGYLIFKLPEQNIRMNILSFEPEKIIGFEWGTGSVQFELTNESVGTQLNFYEVLPKDFDHPVRDITGWYLQLEGLLATIKGEETSFDMNKFQETQVKFEKLIRELKEENA